jgi:acetate kinase
LNSIRKCFVFKTISIILVIAFLNLDIAWAYPDRVPQNHTLAVPSMNQATPFTPQEAIINQMQRFKVEQLGGLWGISRCLFGRDASYGEADGFDHEPQYFNYFSQEVQSAWGGVVDGVDFENIMPLEYWESMAKAESQIDKDAICEQFIEAMPKMRQDQVLVIPYKIQKGVRRVVLVARKDSPKAMEKIAVYPGEALMVAGEPMSDAYVVKQMVWDYKKRKLVVQKPEVVVEKTIAPKTIVMEASEPETAVKIEPDTVTIGVSNKKSVVVGKTFKFKIISTLSIMFLTFSVFAGNSTGNAAGSVLPLVLPISAVVIGVIVIISIKKLFGSKDVLSANEKKRKTISKAIKKRIRADKSLLNDEGLLNQDADGIVAKLVDLVFKPRLSKRHSLDIVKSIIKASGKDETVLRHYPSSFDGETGEWVEGQPREVVVWKINEKKLGQSIAKVVKALAEQESINEHIARFPFYSTMRGSGSKFLTLLVVFLGLFFSGGAVSAGEKAVTAAGTEFIVYSQSLFLGWAAIAVLAVAFLIFLWRWTSSTSFNVKRLKDKSKPVRSHLRSLRKLGKRKEQRALDAIVDALGDENEKVHDKAVDILTSRGKSAVLALTTKMRLAEKRISHAIVQVFQKMGPEVTGTELKAMVDNHPIEVSRAAFIALKEMGILTADTKLIMYRREFRSWIDSLTPTDDYAWDKYAFSPDTCDKLSNSIEDWVEAVVLQLIIQGNSKKVSLKIGSSKDAVSVSGRDCSALEKSIHNYIEEGRIRENLIVCNREEVDERIKEKGWTEDEALDLIRNPEKFEDGPGGADTSRTGKPILSMILPFLAFFFFSFTASAGDVTGVVEPVSFIQRNFGSILWVITIGGVLGSLVALYGPSRNDSDERKVDKSKANESEAGRQEKSVSKKETLGTYRPKMQLEDENDQVVSENFQKELSSNRKGETGKAPLDALAILTIISLFLLTFAISRSVLPAQAELMLLWGAIGTLAFGAIGFLLYAMWGTMSFQIKWNVRRLSSKESDVLENAKNELIAIGEPAVKALIKSLDHENEQVRNNALLTLVAIGESAIPKLIEALGSENLWIRDYAVDALIKIGKPAVPGLMAVLEDAGSSVLAKADAAIVLGKIGDKRAISALILVLGDKDSWVQKQVILALVRFGEPAVPELIEALKNDNYRISVNAAEVLTRMDALTSDMELAMCKREFKEWACRLRAGADMERPVLTDQQILKLSNVIKNSNEAGLLQTVVKDTRKIQEISVNYVWDYSEVVALVDNPEGLRKLIDEALSKQASAKARKSDKNINDWFKKTESHPFDESISFWAGIGFDMLAMLNLHVLSVVIPRLMGLDMFSRLMFLGIGIIVVGYPFWAGLRLNLLGLSVDKVMQQAGCSGGGMAIARSDGYRHEAFWDLSKRKRALINIHESFTFHESHMVHFLQMLAILPGMAFLFRNRAGIQRKGKNSQERLLWQIKEKGRSLFSSVFAFCLMMFSPIKRNIWFSRSKNVYLRRWGVKFLDASNDKGAAKALIGALEDQDASVRTIATFSVLRIGEFALKALAEAEEKGNRTEAFYSILGNSDVWMHSGIFDKMKQIGNPAVPVLIKLLEYSESVLVKVNIVELLGKIADERAVPVLIELLGDENLQIRLSAEVALVRIGKPANDKLQEALKNSTDDAIKEKISEILRRINRLVVVEAKSDIPLPRTAADHTNCALIINCGSSSVKYKLYDMDDETVVKGVDDKGVEGSVDIGGKVTYEKAIKKILENLPVGKEEIKVIGHRVVHGGEDLKESVMITPEVKKVIKKNIPLAPLHNPANLAGIEACEEAFPNTAQVAVFDTAAHQTMEPKAFLYAIPYEFYEKHHIRRYGFHGTSHIYVSDRAAEMIEKPKKDLNIITCHLGNGASVTAWKNGKVVNTSMGTTPLEGLIMGTRSGDVDPALIAIIAKEEEMTVEAVVKLLNKESGLKGVSGISSDMRKLEKAADEGIERAILAREMFILRIIGYIGKYSAEMNGVDAIVFTGGIGEKDRGVQRQVCENLSYLGLEVDRNSMVSKAKERLLTTKQSKVAAMVIPTDEEGVIMRDAKKIYEKMQDDSDDSIVDEPVVEGREAPEALEYAQEELVQPDMFEVVDNKKTGKTQEELEKLFEVIEECLNNRRDKMIRDGNKLIEGVNSYSEESATGNMNFVNSKMLTAEIRERLEKAILGAENLNTSNSRIIELTEWIKKELDQLEADSVVSSTITLAREIGRKKISTNEKRKLVIALDMEWIPGYRAETMGGGKSSEREAMSVLMQELAALGKTMGDHDLKNVEIVFREKGESFDAWSNRIVDKAGNQQDLSNVVVLGSYAATDNFEQKKMLGLQNPAKRAFLAAIHPDALQRLNDFYAKHKDMDELLVIEITKMLSIALELASGKIAPNMSIIDKDSYDPIMRKVMFLPQMDAMKYAELRQHYKAKWKALIAA